MEKSYVPDNYKTLSTLPVRGAFQCKKTAYDFCFVFCLLIAKYDAVIYLMVMQINPNACLGDTDAAS